jgi:hypothetical protein
MRLQLGEPVVNVRVGRRFELQQESLEMLVYAEQAGVELVAAPLDGRHALGGVGYLIADRVLEVGLTLGQQCQCFEDQGTLVPRGNQAECAVHGPDSTLRAHLGQSGIEARPLLAGRGAPVMRACGCGRWRSRRR